MKNDFYCINCNEDVENKDCIVQSNRWVKWYQSRCDCGQVLIRYISDAKIDPYYYKSPKVKRMRALYERDIIQPSDPRFKKHYKEQAQELEISADKIVMKQTQRAEREKAKNKNLIKQYGNEAKKALKQIGEDV